MTSRVCIILVFCMGNLLGFAQNQSVRTTSVSEISYNSIRVLASVEGADFVERGICYSLKPNVKEAENYVSYGTGNFGGFCCKIEHLIPETGYYFRAYGKTNNEVVYGEELYAKTLPLPIPEVKTLSVSEIKARSARIQGRAIGPEMQECGACYSTQKDQEKEGEYARINSKGFGNFSVKLDGLKPETRYFVRFYAINPSGISFGELISFTTE